MASTERHSSDFQTSAMVATVAVGGAHPFEQSVADVLAAVRRRAPRVQCLTNTVAQAITANALHAIGAGASMAIHSDEVVAMSRSADAVLVNLGTPDAARIEAIGRLLAAGTLGDKPVVLDPVFAHASPLRRDLAKQLLAVAPLIVKGNAAEIAALRPLVDHAAAQRIVWITTGATDRIDLAGVAEEVRGGHPWMAAVTGLGCALGAVVAACAYQTSDRQLASRAALSLFAEAGRVAAARTNGPGSFAVAFIDELFRLSSSCTPS
jgi:hydroxyethylthiazole kinase